MAPSAPSPRSPRATGTSPRVTSTVSRGSAPLGTFDIPEDGINVDHPKSFLERFRRGISVKESSISIEAAKNDKEAQKQADINNNPKREVKHKSSSLAWLFGIGTATANDAPEEENSQGKIQEEQIRENNGNEELKVGESSEFIAEECIKTSDDNEVNPETLIEETHEVQPARLEPAQKFKEADHKSNEKPKLEAPMSKKAVATEDNNKEAEPSLTPPGNTEPTSPRNISSDVTEMAIASKELERAADNHEDSLINVVGNDPYLDLLSDQRGSYPVLRFCAGNALLDQHALDTLGLPSGFVWAPFGALPVTTRIGHSPYRCRTCGSFLAPGNGAEEILAGKQTWTCSFCGRDDNSLVGVEINRTTLPELYNDIVQYPSPKGAQRNVSMRGVQVVIVDENLDEDEAAWARVALNAVHKSATNMGLRFVLITVGNGCSVCVRGEGRVDEVPIVELMTLNRARHLTKEEKEDFFLAPPNSKEGSKGANTDKFVKPNTTSTQGGSEESKGYLSADTGQEGHGRFDSKDKQRRLDLAINVAIELMSGVADLGVSRILCLATGPPSLPSEPEDLDEDMDRRRRTVEGSDEALALKRLYERVGVRVGDLRVALDFLCFGACQDFAGPILLGAAKRSRGGLLFSAAHGFSSAQALAEAAVFLTKKSSSPGLASIRVSSPLAVARVIGPAYPTAAPHAYVIPSIDSTVGFTVILKVKESSENPGGDRNQPRPTHGVVQLAAKSFESTRVITTRIPLVEDSSDYLKVLDAEISAIVLGKACIVSGGALTQPEIAARSIDMSARRMLRSSERSAGVVQLLYELRRGLLIDRQISADSALVLRSFFLSGEATLSSLLMSPRFFTNVTSDETSGLMAEVTLEKRHIRKDAVLVLDTGFNVFVYVGEAASREAEDAISESAREVALQRISPCQLWKLQPGPDADYLLDWYLAAEEVQRGGSRAPRSDEGFIRYCKSLAPDSITVRLLQSQ